MAAPQRSYRLLGINSITLDSTSATKGEFFYDQTNETIRLYPGGIKAGNLIATHTWVQNEIANISGIDYNTQLINKPYIPSFATVAQTGSYNDLNDRPVLFSGSYNDLSDKPSIADAQIQSDWDQATNTAKDYIKNKPTIPDAQIQSDWNQANTSAKDYIKNKPTIPAAYASTSINALSDVDTATTPPTNGQSLVWVSASSQWKPATVTSGGGGSTGNITFTNSTISSSDSLITLAKATTFNLGVTVTGTLTATTAVLGSINQHSDVDTATTPPTSGQVLKWNGSNWAPAADVASGGGGTDASTFNGQAPAFYLNYNNLDNRPDLSVYAPIDSPTFTGTVAGITKDMVGLDQVTNISQIDMFINPTIYGHATIEGVTPTGATGTENLVFSNSPTFTGTVEGITKTMVGLSNVDNTSDANKPISTATSTALGLKANLAGGQAFTGTTSVATLQFSDSTQQTTVPGMTLISNTTIDTATNYTQILTNNLMDKTTYNRYRIYIRGLRHTAALPVIGYRSTAGGVTTNTSTPTYCMIDQIRSSDGTTFTNTRNITNTYMYLMLNNTNTSQVTDAIIDVDFQQIGAGAPATEFSDLNISVHSFSRTLITATVYPTYLQGFYRVNVPTNAASNPVTAMPGLYLGTASGNFSNTTTYPATVSVYGLK